MEEQNNNGQLQIELREEVAQGNLCESCIITHSSSEFILDFVRVMPGIPKGWCAISYYCGSRARKTSAAGIRR